MTLRTFLYKFARLLGDINAIQKGTVGKRLHERIGELEAENVALKAAIQSDSPLRLVCSSDKNGALIYEKKLYNATKFLALNQFEELT